MSLSIETRLDTRRRVLIAAVVASSLAAGAKAIEPADRTPATYWVDDIRIGRIAGGEALRSWTAATGAPYTSIASNWNPAVVPAPGDDLLYGAPKSGDYSVYENTYYVHNLITINRALATETVNYSGMVKATSLRVLRGSLNLTLDVFNVTGAGATNSESSIVVGDGSGSNGTLTMSGVHGKYYDARIGVNGANGTFNLTGANTSLTPQTPYVTDSVFGGAANAGNANITVSGATLQAWVITTGKRGATRFTNSAIVSSIPGTSGTGQFQVGSPDGSNVTLEVSSAARLRVTGEDATLLIGSGADSVTRTDVLSGGSIVADLIMTGAESTTGTAASNNTINIAGVGAAITATEAFGTNGGYRFSNNRRGSTNINLTDGGKLYTPRYDSNAADRDADTGATSTTTLNVSGIGTLLSARADLGGTFVASLGDRTVDVTNVSDYARIDTAQMALATGVGASATLNVLNQARVTTGVLEMSRPFRAGPATSSTLFASGGSTVEVSNLVTSSALSATTSVTLRDPTTSLYASSVAMLGGVSGDALGGGSTNFSVLDGASASFVALSAGGASASGATAAYTGTNIVVSGLGSHLELRGSGGVIPAVDDIASNLLLAGNIRTSASLTVSDSGAVTLRDNDDNPNLDGTISMATASNTSASILVDGLGSALDAGTLITMAEAPSANAFTDARATVTVRNGGFLGVYENATNPASGNVQMGIRPSTNSNATLNIGGGTSPDDADSLVGIDGTLFVGGSGDASPVPGARSSVNLNDGSLSAGAIAVYANSTVTINGGHLATDNLMAIGGRVDMSATTPLAMEVGAIRASHGGIINVGKGGAAVYYSTGNGSPSDLDAIRQLIRNGANGGAWNGINGITSSLLSASMTSFAIGYADIDAVGMTSFLDLSFATSAEAVVFRYTLRGDANLDGGVNFDDLLILAQNYGTMASMDWFQGDFSYDRAVAFDDLLLLAQNYGQVLLADGNLVVDSALAGQFASDWALARSLVPEPAGLLLGVAAAGLCRRRR